ncbi:unnamed protein product [Linum tenue]|uniref:Uncharacterized protein n=1 Tax=Linum tenue TaxID=586396 RepID=A0AAV0QQ11_9ROSI|nr:unnamed protein product [Linum tenue]
MGPLYDHKQSSRRAPLTWQASRPSGAKGIISLKFQGTLLAVGLAKGELPCDCVSAYFLIHNTYFFCLGSFS